VIRLERDVGAYFQDRPKGAFAQTPIVGEVRGVATLEAVEFAANREKKSRFDAEFRRRSASG